MRVEGTEIYQALEKVLNEEGLPFRVEHGGKHPRLVISVNGRDEFVVCSASPSDRRAHLNAAAFLKRRIAAWRSESEPPSKASPVVVADEPQIVVEVIDGEPRVLDTELATKLGMDRPTNIRQVIDRNRDEIEGFGPLHSANALVEIGSGARRSVSAYYLNEEQALLVSILSRAPNAPAVRAGLIRAFVAFRRGQAHGMAMMTDRLDDLRAADDLTLDGIARIEQALAKFQNPLMALPDWKDEAKKLRRQGFTYEEIGRRLCRPLWDVAKTLRGLNSIDRSFKWAVIAAKAERGVRVARGEWTA
jgi:hypothetical protein